MAKKTDSTSHPLIPGFSRFELISQAGFGTVYKARQEDLGRDVAIKVLAGAQIDDRARQRFDRERRAMGALSQHPGIVTLYESGFTDSGVAYLVMELMEGGSLGDHLDKQGPMPPDEAVGVMRKVAIAVAEAHSAGVLHRDIKPENILLSRYGEPKLADFGIAALLEGTIAATTTVSATVEHAAPEILDGAPPTEKSDIYSLGSTLFALLTGGSPFRRDSDESMLTILKRTLIEPPPDLEAAGVPEALRSAIESSLAKDPTGRPSSVESFIELLGRTADEAATTRLPVAGDADRAPAARRLSGRSGTRMIARPNAGKDADIAADSGADTFDVLRSIGIRVGVVILLGATLALLWGLGSSFEIEPQTATTLITTSTTAMTTTTSTTTTTTSTTIPLAELEAGYAQLFSELIADGGINARAAAEVMAVGPAADSFVAFIEDVGYARTNVVTESEDGHTFCGMLGSAETCMTLDDFEFDGENVVTLGLNGARVETVLAGPFPPHPDDRSEPSQNYVCWIQGSEECNYDNPQRDVHLYARLKWFYADPDGPIVAGWDVVTGARDLDVRVSQDVFLSTVSLGDVTIRADECWSDIARDQTSSIGLRILSEQRGLLWCRWDGFGQTARLSDEPIVISVGINWQRNGTLEYEVARLDEG